MLILTRRPAETIYIGEQVTVTVLGVVGNQVRFGIEAPRSITIDRAEIHERKKRAALAKAYGNGARQRAGPGPTATLRQDAPEDAAEVNGNVADEHADAALSRACRCDETAPLTRGRRSLHPQRASSGPGANTLPDVCCGRFPVPLARQALSRFASANARDAACQRVERRGRNACSASPWG